MSYQNLFQHLKTLSQSDRTALIIDHPVEPRSMTYQELWVLLGRYQQTLKEDGLVAGDVLLALLPNSSEMLLLFLASMTMGLHLSPLPCETTPHEFERWRSLIKPKYCYVKENIRTDLLAHIDTLHIPKKTIPVDHSFQWLSSKEFYSDQLSLSQLYLATSGTTGAPKAIVLNGEKLWKSALHFSEIHDLSLNEKTCFWNYLPMSYLGGLFNLGLIPLSVSGSVVLGEPFSGKTFLNFWQTVQRYSINVLWFVPTIIRGLLEMVRRNSRLAVDLKKLGILKSFVGTAPLDLKTKEEFEHFFNTKLLENYGLSETTFISSEKQGADLRSEGSVGCVISHVDLRLMNKEKKGSEGEICVKTPFLFEGYLDSDQSLNLPLDSQGYFHTGDFGCLDSHGNLVLTGRSRDFIKKGGQFIVLREIEVLATEYPFVVEAAAVKKEHAFYGEAFDLFVVAKDENIAGLEKFIHQKLARSKWPEKILSISEMPKTASGKIQKHLLKERMFHE